MKLGMRELARPKKLYNIDDTTNKAGNVTHYVDLMVETAGQKKEMRFLVSDVGREDAILGYPWLATFEPSFSWAHGTIDVKNLPIVLRSVHPTPGRPTINRIAKEEITTQPAEECEARGASTDLAIKAHDEQKETTIPPEYKQFASVFSNEESQRFPPPRPWDHAIELKPDAPSHLRCKVYPMTREEDEALNEFIDDHLLKGYIEPSKSPYASPFFFVKKKDGKLRPVQDYRALNSWTVKNQYPLPLIPVLIRDLGGAFIYSKLDVRWGYNNIRIRAGDEWKAAFKTSRGLHQPKVMFFGMSNSPPTFQGFMDDIYYATIAKHEARGTFIRIYMDDIGVATKVPSLQAHIDAVSDVLQVAQEHSLYFKPEKCLFHVPSMEYLGLILERTQTRMDPVKVAGVREWPTPTTIKGVRSFLGFCNYYRAFVQNFSELALPLNALTKKGVEFTWTTREQEAFDALKQQITSSPTLAHPNMEEQFELEVDASGSAMGAVLLQRQPDGTKKPINFMSKTFNQAQRNYDIFDREFLAMLWGLQHSRPLLVGSPHKVIVRTDHKNLRYWRDPQKISRRIAREVLELADYDIEIHHLQGKDNGRADALSRREDHDTGEHDNEGVVVLPDHLFARTTRTANMSQDESIVRRWVDPHRLKNIGGRWTKDGRQVITGDLEERRTVITSLHDAPAYGHPGISRTVDFVERSYWWPGLRRDVAEYVRGCGECQRHKVNNRPTKAPLQPIYPRDDAIPFEVVALDFITKLPPAQGYDSILTITDQGCTKMTHFIPCNEAVTAEETARIFLEVIVRRYGLPSKIISDRDPRFTSKFTQELCRTLGIQQNISSAYHPRTDGQSERNNQWVETYLRFYTNHRQTDWAAHLPLAEFAHNNWKNETTKNSPFFLLMGYHPRADGHHAASNSPLVERRLDNLLQARSDARTHMTRAQQLWVKHRDTPKYAVGDRVWLDGRNLRTDQPTSKLAPRRHGPFAIAQVMSPVSYRLELPHQWRIHPVFHTDLLTPYRETKTHGENYQRPPPELIDNEEEFEVEAVLDSRRFGRGRKLQYLVKWLGYPDSDNQWEDADKVHADELVKIFRQRHPDKETHLRRGRIAESSSSHSPMPCSRNDNYSFSTGADSPTYATSNYDVNNNVDDVDDSLLALEYLAVLDAERRANMARSHADSSEDDVATSGARVGTGSNGASPGAPSHDEDPNTTSGGEAVQGGRMGTPHPKSSIAITIGSHTDDDDDDDIRCGQCEDPIAYCHCEPLPVRARVVPIANTIGGGAAPAFPRRNARGTVVLHDWTQAEDLNDDDLNQRGSEEEDDEEAALPGEEAKGEEGEVVPHRGRGRIPEEGHAGRRVPPHRAGTSTTTASRKRERARSATPDGYVVNRGTAYVPIIILQDGRRTPAKYVRVIMSDNPEVFGTMGRGEPIFRAEIHAARSHDYGKAAEYTPADLRYLRADYAESRTVDDALSHIGDVSLTAEVRRYRAAAEICEQLENQIRALEDNHYHNAERRRQSAQRLGRAQAVKRIREEHVSNTRLVAVPNWVVERGRSA